MESHRPCMLEFQDRKSDVVTLKVPVARDEAISGLQEVSRLIVIHWAISSHQELDVVI